MVANPIQTLSQFSLSVRLSSSLLHPCSPPLHRPTLSRLGAFLSTLRCCLKMLTDVATHCPCQPVVLPPWSYFAFTPLLPPTGASASASSSLIRSMQPRSCRRTHALDARQIASPSSSVLNTLPHCLLPRVNSRAPGRSHLPRPHSLHNFLHSRCPLDSLSPRVAQEQVHTWYRAGEQQNARMDAGGASERKSRSK